jgi:hypothetical protein
VRSNGRSHIPLGSLNRVGLMGKTGKERKRRKLLLQQQGSFLSAPLSEDDDDNQQQVGGVSTAETAIATKVLMAMAASPEAFKGKEFKALRAALHSLRQSEGASMVLGFGTKEVSLSQVVSDALRDSRWPDALRALDTMRQRKHVPKLGSVQRWVRECDAAGDDDADAMLVLDSVLRTADPAQVGAMQSAGAQEALRQADGSIAPGVLRCEGRVRWYPPWDAFGRGGARPSGEEAGATMREAQGTSEEAKSVYRSRFASCFYEKAQDRKPPNRHPLTIHASQPGAVQLDPCHAAARRIEVPFVPGAFLIADLFTGEECRQIIHVGEAIGYDPDEKADGTSAADKKSILAHAFVWCTDEAFIETVWHRVKDLVPRQVSGGRPLGLNRRWRCYRYVQGSVYRPHIDGAWPGSGVDEEGNYVYDAFADGRTSRLTFLIYLNDDFDGGCTSFFMPSASEHGVLDARGVMPRKCAALVFPHGDTIGALLHEGSAVNAGAKYVVRTEVLYSMA